MYFILILPKKPRQFIWVNSNHPIIILYTMSHQCFCETKTTHSNYAFNKKNSLNKILILPEIIWLSIFNKLTKN